MIDDPVAAALMLAVPLGIGGVFALALADRVIPLLPSPGLFAAIGVAAADGVWCVTLALIASILGSGTGALSAYSLGAVARRRNSRRLRMLMRRRDRWGAALRMLRRRGATLPLAAQLVPATRLLSPLLGGVVAEDPRGFLVSTGLGIAIWNTAFIALGYAIFRVGGSVNLTILSIALSTVVLVALWAARSGRVRTLPAITARRSLA